MRRPLPEKLPIIPRRVAILPLVGDTLPSANMPLSPNRDNAASPPGESSPMSETPSSPDNKTVAVLAPVAANVPILAVLAMPVSVAVAFVPLDADQLVSLVQPCEYVIMPG